MKMGLDRTNYEIWLTDYLDGNLSNSQVDQLMIFLRDNPDIREELGDITSYYLTPVEGSFKNKDSLRKSISEITDTQFELLCIAESEKDLSTKQSEELSEIIALNPEKRKIFELISKLKLSPPEVEFKNKFRLIKLTLTQKVIRYSVIGLSAAASVVIALYVFNQQNSNNQIPLNIASTDPFNKKPVIINKEIAVENPLTEESPKLQTLVSQNINPVIQNTQVKYDSSPVLDPISADSVIKNTPPEKINISMIDFKPEVRLANINAGGDLIALNIQDIPLVQQENTGLNGFIARVFREKIFKSESPARGNLRAYEIADAGISGLNKLFGWDMSLQKNKDEKGEVKSVNFNSKLLKFNAPVKKVMPLP